MSANPELKEKIEHALRTRFQGETVDVSDGYGDNVHVIVVSRRFNGLQEKEKQDLLWQELDQSGLTDEEKVKISLILPYSPADLK